MGMHTDGKAYGIEPFSNRLGIVDIGWLRADRNHPFDIGLIGTLHDIFNVRAKLWKIKVAMAVNYLDHCVVRLRSRCPNGGFFKFKAHINE